MRILIAEDELLERKAMKKFIENNFSDMHVVAEAINGRKAIEFAETTEPDIIIMDIKMPGINGLEAIEKISETAPWIKFILLSAYDSFDYAKQAMRFGIKDYILKPGKKEEIVRTLLRVKKEVIAEQERRNEKEQSIQLLRERFVAKVMQYPLQEEAAALQKQLFPKMKNACFLVLKSDDPYTIKDVERTCKTLLGEWFILVQNEDTFVGCVVKEEITDKAELLKSARKLQIVFGEEMYIGIGLPCTSIEKLPKSYHDAYAASVQLKTENKSNYGFLHVQAKEKGMDEIIQKICRKVEKGNGEEAILHYNKHHHLFLTTNKEDLYIAIKRLLSERHIPMVETSFSSINTDKDFQTFIHVSCMKINDFYQSKQYITQAKKFIYENYQQAITLDDTAMSVNLSPNYFSNLFKQEFGMTFIDFLTKVRLEKAKELIEENAYTLKEISFMIGYKDPNYFSRVFKKYYNESPKHFQKEIFRK